MLFFDEENVVIIKKKNKWVGPNDERMHNKYF